MFDGEGGCYLAQLSPDEVKYIRNILLKRPLFDHGGRRV